MTEVRESFVEHIQEAVRIVCRDIDAETKLEFVQEGVVRFLTAHYCRRVAMLEPSCFAFGIVYNLRRKHIEERLRERSRRLEIAESDLRSTIVDRGPSPEAWLISQETGRHVKHFIAQLHCCIAGAELGHFEHNVLLGILRGDSDKETRASLGLTSAQYSRAKWRAKTKLARAMRSLQ